MTTEQRQAAILRHMGWEDICYRLFDGQHRPISGQLGYPQWPSLDALALVEAGLTQEQDFNYRLKILPRVTGDSGGKIAITATFTQRLHALCLTLGLEEPS